MISLLIIISIFFLLNTIDGNINRFQHKENPNLSDKDFQLLNADSHSENLISLIPKLELHAHIHGSIRRSTLLELASKHNLSESLNCDYKHDINMCFSIFSVVHQVVSSKEILTRILYEILEDYMADNVIYLELRTTPRLLEDTRSHTEYIELVYELIKSHNLVNGHKMLVKLIISIDRRTDIIDATDTFELTKRIYLSDPDDNKIIVGIDFSGNPHIGRFDKFSNIFTMAREIGLKITIHSGEIKELSYPSAVSDEVDEMTFILNYKPDRIGHALFLQTSHINTLISLLSSGSPIPIEVCPTSNLVTLGLQSYADHPHIRKLLSLGHPVSINTDDSGIFETSLTKEFLHIKNALSLSVLNIVEIIVSTLKQTFLNDKEEKDLETLFWSKMEIIFETYYIKGIDQLRSNENKPIVDMSSLYTM